MGDMVFFHRVLERIMVSGEAISVLSVGLLQESDHLSLVHEACVLIRLLET